MFKRIKRLKFSAYAFVPCMIYVWFYSLLDSIWWLLFYQQCTKSQQSWAPRQDGEFFPGGDPKVSVSPFLGRCGSLELRQVCLQHRSSPPSNLEILAQDEWRLCGWAQVLPLLVKVECLHPLKLLLMKSFLSWSHAASRSFYLEYGWV